MDPNDYAPVKNFPLAEAKVTPDQNVVDVARYLLGLAESGKLRGIVYIGLLLDQDVNWGIHGAEMKTQKLRAVGLVEWLKKQIMELWEQTLIDTEPPK